MQEYDVSRIFKRIEEILIASLIRNLKKHRVENDDWEAWQALQLKELERYRRSNEQRFYGQFADINEFIARTFAREFRNGAIDGVAMILNNADAGSREGFFGINDRKLNALIDSVTEDLTRGERAIIPRAVDAYRKIIADAQVFASAGGSYEQAVDMATKDFISAGVRTIEYSNGSRHSLKEYASMAIRTGNKRAYLMGEGESRRKYGVHTVRVNNRNDKPCPLCIKWIGKVLVDDVYSGGTLREARELKLPALSEAMALGFLHPNCKDMVSTYIEGVSKPAKKWTKKELQEITEAYNEEQAKRQAENMVEKYDRLAKYSLDPANKQRYEARADEWREKVEEESPVEAILKSVEDGIRGLRHEWVVLIDSDTGEELINVTEWSETQVDLNHIAGAYFRNNILTHNHPSGATFSWCDVALAVNRGVREVRACHAGGVYSLVRKYEIRDKIPAKYYDFAWDYVQAQKKYKEDVTDIEWENSNKDKETAERLNNMTSEFARMWLKENSSSYGWEYKEETL